jgi:hypothetical protein
MLGGTGWACRMDGGGDKLLIRVAGLGEELFGLAPISLWRASRNFGR